MALPKKGATRWKQATASNSTTGMAACLRNCVCEQTKLGTTKKQTRKHTHAHTRAERQQDTHENCYCCCFNNVGKTNVLRQDKQQQQHEQAETMCNIRLAACVQFKALRLLHFVNGQREGRGRETVTEGCAACGAHCECILHKSLS